MRVLRLPGTGRGGTSAEDQRGRAPRRPHDDPFHDVPGDLATLTPGTVIRARRVTVALLGLVPQGRVEAWQVAYRSTDLHGEPEVAVATVMRRRGVEPTGLIAYQCAIDAVSDRCFPSYALRAGARAWGALPQFEMFLIARLLDLGYAVSASDHEGLLGTFAAPREPGHRVLDGVRAVRSLEELDLPEDLPVGMFGYSGGGMATAWAAEMAPTYAPELPIVGAVLGSPVGDPGEAFIKLNGGLFAGLPALVVAGLRHVYPGLAEVVRDHASSEGRQRLDRLEEITTTEACVRYALDDFDDYLDSPLADVLALPEVLHVFDDLRLGHRAPTCPLLVVQSRWDQIIDVDDVDSQVERYVTRGADVLYLRDGGSEHISLMLLGFPVMLDWLVRRFEDHRASASGARSTGTRDHLSLALHPSSWPGFVALGAAAARTVLGRA